MPNCYGDYNVNYFLPPDLQFHLIRRLSCCVGISKIKPVTANNPSKNFTLAENSAENYQTAHNLISINTNLAVFYLQVIIGSAGEVKRGVGEGGVNNIKHTCTEDSKKNVNLQMLILVHLTSVDVFRCIFFSHYFNLHTIDVAPIMQLCMCVMKIIHIQGGSHHVVSDGPYTKGKNSLPLGANSFL